MAIELPGGVTSNVVGSTYHPIDPETAAIINAQAARQQAGWARAAAMNNARAAQANAGGDQGHYLPSTASQTSGMGYGQSSNNQGPVLWAPRNLQGPKLGTWASQQQNRAIAENREMPIVLQAHTNDPYSPGEVGGGVPANVLGRGIYGPGLTGAMGGANPAVWAKMWGGGGSSGGGGGRTRQAESINPFPAQSLRERTSPGPQYQYDALYRG